MTTKLRPAALTRCLLLGFVGLLAVPTPARAVDEVIDSVMFSDPDIPKARSVKVFHPRLTSLWLRALERPEVDLKCQAAAAIALAHQRGMAGLESTVGPLVKALDQADQHPTMRLAAAQALIALDARQAAPNLYQAARAGGIDMANLVEPALARWDFKPAREAWLERLTQPGHPRRGSLLAIRGLGAVREPKAAPKLLALTLSATTDPIVRLEAARAMGTIQATGLEKEAVRLVEEKPAPGSVSRLAAASLLRKHRGDEATKVLQRLAVEDDPATATVALEGLLDADPRQVMPLMRQLVASPDATVRSRAVESHRRCPLTDHIPLVVGLLDDPHPQVRTQARKALVEVARTADHREAVLREATRLLTSDRWRGMEQAILLAVTLDHKPASARLVGLLGSDRPEVFVSAAWGLRKLAVPETLPAQLGEIERRWRRSRKPDAKAPHAMIDLQVAQLAQSMGQSRYAPAAPVLVGFIPKVVTIGTESRAAAVWALGRIHEKSPPNNLVKAFIERLTDDDVVVEEHPRVRAMAAVSLGRMKSKEAVAALRQFYPKRLTDEPVPNACGWALQQITGEPLPSSGTVPVAQKGWFLEPND